MIFFFFYIKKEEEIISIKHNNVYRAVAVIKGKEKGMNLKEKYFLFHTILSFSTLAISFPFFPITFRLYFFLLLCHEILLFIPSSSIFCEMCPFLLILFKGKTHKNEPLILSRAMLSFFSLFIGHDAI